MPAGTRATPQAPASISSCSLGVRQRISLPLSLSVLLFPSPSQHGGLRASHVSCGMRNPSWIHHVCVSLGLHLLTKVNQRRYTRSSAAEQKDEARDRFRNHVRRLGLLQRKSAMPESTRSSVSINYSPHWRYACIPSSNRASTRGSRVTSLADVISTRELSYTMIKLAFDPFPVSRISGSLCVLELIAGWMRVHQAFASRCTIACIALADRPRR